MTTEISYFSEQYVRIVSPEGNFVCPINRCGHHEGMWNSRVLAFVPQQTADTFSDGTPVASYESWN